MVKRRRSRNLGHITAVDTVRANDILAKRCQTYNRMRKTGESLRSTEAASQVDGMVAMFEKLGGVCRCTSATGITNFMCGCGRDTKEAMKNYRSNRDKF